MKNTCKYQLLVALLLLAHTSIAKDGVKQLPPTTTQIIHNAGQITDQHSKLRSDIDFKITNGGVTMFVGSGQLHYQWTKQIPNEKSQIPNEEPGASGPAPTPPKRGNLNSHFEGGKRDVEIYRMDVTLVGANPNAAVLFEEPTGYYENYYLAHTGENGAVAKGYSRVTYKNVYPNIDLALYVNSKVEIPNHKVNPKTEIPNPNTSSNVKYDFIIHPGGDPADIRLRYDGATELKLVDGALVAVTPYGTITEDVPYSYDAETKTEVASKYLLTGNELRFDVGQYNGTLVIDPTLVWGTYYGGTSLEYLYGQEVDNEDNIYIAGSTTSSNNIATTGAFQTTHNNDFDGYLAKFTPSGTLIWATYYGGVSFEHFTSIAIDKHGRVYMFGMSASAGLATTGAFRTNVVGQANLLVKFDKNGNRIWATYYSGGSSSVDAETMSVVCDAGANVYIGSTARVDTGVATTGTHMAVRGGGYNDCYIAKFDSAGNRLWGTYYGGSGVDYSGGLHVDMSGNVYLIGDTHSTDSIATTGSHKPTLGGAIDGFIAKFNSNGIRLWGSYFGGNSSEYCSGITSDKQGFVYFSGETTSTTGIATPGSNQSMYMGGARDGFLAKMSSTGVLQWSTYVGGSSNDRLYDLDIDSMDNIYFSGDSRSLANIATPCAYQTNLNGGAGANNDDAFWGVYKSSGNKVYSTYYGGALNDPGAYEINWHKGLVYISGTSPSTSGIATSGTHQPTHSGGTSSEGFLAKFDIRDTGVYIVQPFLDTALCTGDTIRLKYEVLYKFKSNNVFTFQLSGPTGSFNSPTTMGSVSSDTSGMFTYIIPGNITSGAGYRIRIAASSPAFISCDNGINIGIGNKANKPVAVNNGPLCSGDTLKLTATTSTTGVSWKWTGPNNFSYTISNPTKLNSQVADSGDYIVYAEMTGCRVYDTTTVIVRQSPLPVSATVNTPICERDTLKLTASANSVGVVYGWTGPNSFTDTARNPVVPNAPTTLSGPFIVTVTLNGCTRKDTVTATVKPYPVNYTTGSNSPVCATKTLTLNAASSSTGVMYTWAGPGGYNSTAQNPTITSNAGSTHAGDYINTATLNGCTSRDTVTVIVLPKPAMPTAGAVNTSLCARQDLQLTAGTVTATNYNWYGPGGFVATTQNPIRNYIQMNQGGKYYVYVTLNGCISDTDSVAVVVNTDPVVNIFPTPGASICAGQQVIFTAIPTNGGTAPTYQWRVNGIPTGGTAVSYSSTAINNGDIVTCHMTSTTTCSTPFTDTSNPITMMVLPVLAPSVTIAANPTAPWNDNVLVTFTATPTNGGAVPQYQWRRNGANINGATSSTWGIQANQLSNNDNICVVLKSGYECPQPDTALSNCISAAFTGVRDFVNKENIQVYPNPTNNVVTITATATIEKVAVSNLIGQTLLLQEGNSKTMSINLGKFAAGVYVLKVNDSYVVRVVKE